MRPMLNNTGESEPFDFSHTCFFKRRCCRMKCCARCHHVVNDKDVSGKRQRSIAPPQLKSVREILQALPLRELSLVVAIGSFERVQQRDMLGARDCLRDHFHMVETSPGI